MLLIYDFEGIGEMLIYYIDFVMFDMLLVVLDYSFFGLLWVDVKFEWYVLLYLLGFKKVCVGFCSLGCGVIEEFVEMG